MQVQWSLRKLIVRVQCLGAVRRTFLEKIKTVLHNYTKHMSRWSAAEINLLEEYLRQNPRQLTQEDHAAISTLIQVRWRKDRSQAAIKKKIIEVKRNREQDGQQNPPLPQAWTPEETQRLVERFTQANGATRTAKIREILEDFSGRSEKAVATKLRESFPKFITNEK